MLATHQWSVQQYYYLLLVFSMQRGKQYDCQYHACSMYMVDKDCAMCVIIICTEAPESSINAITKVAMYYTTIRI